MQAFQVIRNLETRQLKADKVEDVLHPELVVLLTDDASRNIFLYRGENAPLIDYWVGKKAALEVRKFMRGFYSIKELTSEETINKLKKNTLSDEGKVFELFNPNFHEEEETQEVVDSGTKIVIETDINWKEKLEVDKLEVFEHPDIAQVQKKVKDLPDIEGHKSEMVLVGTAMYNRTEVIDSIFKNEPENKILEKKTSTKFEKLGNLPEGFFFKPGYSSRIIIENGKFHALEFLMKTDGKKKSTESDRTVGEILAPVLIRKDLVNEHPFEIIKNAYSLEEEKPIDLLLQEAKDFIEQGQE